MRCSCVGATSGWMTYTSRCRQFSCNWTYRQSLLNRRISTGDSGTPRESQMLVARGRWALPDSTTISRMGGAYGDALRRRDGEPRALVRRLLELVDDRHREVGVG